MITKICRKCSEKKSVDEYYPHLRMRGGVLNICKSCVKARTNESYKLKMQDPSFAEKERLRAIEKAHRLRYSIKYRTENLSPEQIESRVKSKKEYAERNKQARLEKQKIYRLHNRDKYLARSRLKYAVKSGVVTKAPCRECGALKVEAHHPDYLKPLEIIWLCSTCHGKEHRKCL
jgi:superfamily II helicase